MDYVIFGIALGAALVLAGWGLQQFGPSMRYRVPPNGVQSGSQLVLRLAWERFCTSAGLVLIVLGTILLLVTFITLIVSPPDRTGTFIVLATVLLLILAAAVWAWFYVQRFGLTGIVDRERRRKREHALRTWSESSSPSEPSAITVHGPPLPEDFSAIEPTQRAGRPVIGADDSSEDSFSPQPPQQSNLPHVQHHPSQPEHPRLSSQQEKQTSPRFVMVREQGPKGGSAHSDNTAEPGDDSEM